ncbi:L,D-transpeptidase Cds6 family protein [Methylophilus sp.]|uniref:L,D-transpeptidase Cds6 family protein n=1 Tax=Methylophilus sp. TaxID=29541 RepID=UPI0040360A48
MKPFKMEVQQGNVVTSKMLLQLRPGMTRTQVRYIMGTPLIVDSFRDNRWDYFYELRKQGSVVEKRRVILDFDKDSLVAVRGDVIPSADNPDIKTIVETPKQKVEEAKDQSWSDKLKFWKSDEAADTGAAAATGAGVTALAAEQKNAEEAAATPAAAAPATETQPASAEAEKPQVTAPAAEPAPAAVAAAPQAAPAAPADNEVVPYIPEGEYSGAPSPQEMAKANLDASANQVTEANTQAVNEKTLAASTAESVEPPPVFQAEAVAAPAPVAEPEPVLPPAVSTPAPAPAAPAAKTAAPAAKSVLAPIKPAAAPTLVAATATAAAAKPASSKLAPSKPAAANKPLEAKPVAAKPATTPAAASKATGITIIKTKDPALLDDDEVIPFIAEGEYAEPVIPTEGEMIKGNMAEANAPAIDAEARQVTEKGVAPKEAEAAEPTPTFIAEQLPEPEPEPELPPPPVKPVAKASTPATDAGALAAAENKPAAILKPAAPQADTSAATAETAPQASATSDAGVNQSVAAWAQAWRSKDVNAYFAAYAPEFVPEGVSSRKTWEAQRKQRLSSKQGEITLVLNNLQVQRDGGEAVVQFEQKYAAKAYKDELLKTLELRYEPAQKRWLITHERTAPLGSAALPAVVALPNKAVVAAPAASEAKVQIPVEADPSVESAIEGWAQAWRSKNINAYLAAYSPEFVPEDLPNKRAWEAQRKKRLSPGQGNISLEIDAVNVTRDGDTAVATFTQKYAAKAYRDVMVKKLQLKLDPASHNWLIVRETATTATDLPPAKQQLTTPPAADEASSESSEAAPEQIGF